MKLKREVKVIIVIVSIILLGGLIGTCVLLNKKEEVKEPTIGINTEEVSTTTEAVIEEATEEQPTNRVEQTKPEQTKASTTKQTQTTQKKTVVTTEPTTQAAAKRTCTNSDAGWQQRIAKRNSEKDMVFTSRAEAEAYANYAMSIGYGYWINQAKYPEKYEDETCVIEYHTVNLYVTAKSCSLPDGTMNPSFTIPATPKNKLISDFDYLRSQGYDCGNKTR